MANLLQESPFILSFFYVLKGEEVLSPACNEINIALLLLLKLKLFATISTQYGSEYDAAKFQ